MRMHQSELCLRLVQFLDLDRDGFRRLVVQTMLEMGEFTISSLHGTIAQHMPVSQKALASMIGYICSRLGLLHISRSSYRSPRTYVLKEEYAEMARSALMTCGNA